MQRLYEVRSVNGVLIMIAPITTLREAFSLRNEAIERLMTETELPAATCRLHFNGRSRLGFNIINVMWMPSTQELFTLSK